MTTYNIRKLRSGRIADENPATWVGQLGTIFYNEATGALRISDGVTPGGVNLPFAIASTSQVGGIKAGPGANVSVDGTLTINTAGLPVSFGNIDVVDTTLTTVNTNADLILASNGTGNVELRGNIHFHTTTSPTSNPFFTANSDGQVTILVPAADPLAGAVKIVGSNTGGVFPPLNTGVMLQLTGNTNDPSRLYNDAVNNFAAFVGRRLNGTLASPTAIQAGNELIRISSTGHNGTTIPGSGSARILYQAIENYTPTAVGTNISIWTTAVGSNVLTKTATIDSANGIVVSKATISGNVTVGNIAVSGGGTITTPRVVINDGGIRSIQDGIWANLSFASDSIVHLYQPSGDVTVNLSNYQAGATIRLLINMATARNINLGVPSTNSTNGTTQLTAAKISNNQAVQIVYTCIDGTSANCHAALSYA